MYIYVGLKQDFHFKSGEESLFCQQQYGDNISYIYVRNCLQFEVF